MLPDFSVILSVQSVTLILLECLYCKQSKTNKIFISQEILMPYCEEWSRRRIAFVGGER